MIPALILVCGLPGSGKSFFAQHLSKKTAALYLNSDLLRKELFPDKRSYSEPEKQFVYDTLLARTQSALFDHKPVLVDATFYKQELRIPFYALAQKNNIPLYIFYITADEALIKERTSVTRTDSEADFSVYVKLKNLFEPITLPYKTLVSDKNNIDTLLTNALTYLSNGKK